MTKNQEIAEQPRTKYLLKRVVEWANAWEGKSTGQRLECAAAASGHRRPGSCHFSCLQGVQRYRRVIRRFDVGGRLPARTWGCSTRKAFTSRRWSIKLSVCATVIAQSENNHMRHDRTWLTPASSSEFGKADGSEAEEDSSDIFLCAIGFEPRPWGFWACMT